MPIRAVQSARARFRNPSVARKAAPLQGAAAAPEGQIADGVEDGVVGLPVLGEVLLRGVDDVASSERPHEPGGLGVADSGDLGSEGTGQLHRGGADGPRGAVDEDRLPLLQMGWPQGVQGQDRPVADCRRRLEARAGRHGRQGASGSHAEELRVGTELPWIDAEDEVADRELGDGCSDRVDLSGQVAAEDPSLRPPEAGDDAGDEWLGRAKSAVRPADRRCADPDPDFVVLGEGPRNLFEAQDVRWPVPVMDNRSHEFLVLNRWGWAVGRVRMVASALTTHEWGGCRRPHARLRHYSGGGGTAPPVPSRASSTAGRRRPRAHVLRLCRARRVVARYWTATASLPRVPARKSAIATGTSDSA